MLQQQTVNVGAAPTCSELKSSQAVIMVSLVSIALVDWYSQLVQVPSRSQSVGTMVLVTLYTGPALLCPNWKLETTLPRLASAWALHRQFFVQRSAL